MIRIDSDDTEKRDPLRSRADRRDGRSGDRDRDKHGRSARGSRTGRPVESVTIIDRDSLLVEPAIRRGVAQGAYPHALLEAGRATIADLLPGYGEHLISAGGVVVDFASNVNFYTEGGFLAHGPTRMETYSANRPLCEQVVRQYGSDLDGVHIRSDYQFTDYLLDDAAVVDATGRTSRTPTWLEDYGYTRLRPMRCGSI